MQKHIGSFVAASSLIVILLLTYAHLPVSAQTGDLFQFNNLTVQSAPSDGTGEIITTRQNVQCIRYASIDSKTGITSICPLPPGSSAESANYRIVASENTSLLLRNREKGKLADFTTGDKLNAYGYYREDGSIAALTIRNLTKPIPQSEIQLNSAEVIGISTSSPMTLIVIQDAYESCTKFEGNTSWKSVCPAGLRVITDGPVAGTLSYPEGVKKRLDAVRKYEIRLNANTVVLDRGKKPMSPTSIIIGDKMNVFGSYDAKTAAPRVVAAVVRDLSQPKLTRALKQFEGIVTQINAGDGSFVLRSKTGELVTVANPIQYDALLHIKGNYDETTNTFTAVEQVTAKPKTGVSAIPIITTLNPGIASIGTHITIQGTGFTKIGNAVHFGSGYTPNLSSLDGTTILFTIPATIIMKCRFATPQCLVPEIPVTEGEHFISVENANGTSNTGKFTVAPLPPLSITTPSLPQVVEQTYYQTVVEARGGTGTYEWNVSQGTLPPGLALVRATCVLAPCRTPLTIKGTPTVPGTHTFTLSLTSGGETTAKEFVIVVVPALGRGY